MKTVLRSHFANVIAGAALVLMLVAAGAPAPAQSGWDEPVQLAQGLFGPAAGADEKPVAIRAQFALSTDDRPARLYVTATMKEGWYVYSITQPPGGPIATKITLDETDAVKLAGPFRPSPKPKKKVEPIFDDLVVETHSGTVTWYAPIELAPGVDPQKLKIPGEVRAQPCEANRCLPPQSFAFTASLGPGVKVVEQAEEETPAEGAGAAAGSPRRPSPGGDPPRQQTGAVRPAPGTAEESGSRLPWRPYTTFESFERLLGPAFDADQLERNVREGLGTTPLGVIIVFGLVGGLILNLMPCVLPVIGLKVLSFVEQSGHDRKRALMLNLWYSAGLMSVFLLLAALAAFLQLGWGSLFSYAGFNIVLAAVVFAMGLSFLGVWEIPIPGFIGSGKTAELAQKEGFSGAFAKGVVTTVLATPCTGPLMGTALAWAVRQPPAHIFAVFGSVGLGMASPYLLIGVFPSLVKFLPKPGEWMETFKKVMGFVLLGTVVFILTFLQWSYVVPTIGLLFAIWAACWWMGRTPGWAEMPVRARSWLEAAAFVGIAWLVLFPGIDEVVSGRFAFPGLHDVTSSRFEEKLEKERQFYLERLRSEGYELVKTDTPTDAPGAPKTVLVDITADWCLTCKTLEAAYLNTPAVKDLVEKNGVVPLKADWTERPPEVTELMRRLGAGGVPVVAVFPADNPNEPTAVFRDGYTEGQILEALREAGPSKTPSSWNPDQLSLSAAPNR